MTKKRIEYIDCIKGFAILLVVMGHVIANWFEDFYTIFSHDTENQLMLWNLIYSFHMPLFMFCSGLFQPIMTKQNSVKDFIYVIYRRFKVLMIPYFCSGMILWYVSGQPTFYWFLLVLFEFILINLFISFAFCRFQSKSNLLEILMFLTVYIIIRIVSSKYQEYEKLPLLDIGHLGMYIYFTLGYLVTKYKLLEKIHNNYVYTISIILFVGLYVDNNICNLPLVNFGLGIVRTCAAIIVVFCIFKKAYPNKIMSRLNNLGRRSLEIYILHFFFLSIFSSCGGGGQILFS